MNNELTLRKFLRADYKTYQSWFSDPQLQKVLGGVDEEWLEHILAENQGIELAILSDKKLIGLVGIVFPTIEESAFGITNIAIRPDLKNKGLGTNILEQIFKKFPLKGNEYWICYVETFNVPAQRFFEKNGWKRGKVEEEMIKYAFKVYY